MSNEEIIIIIISSLVLLFAAISAYIYIRCKSYTREKFALYVFVTNSTLSVNIIILLLTGRDAFGRVLATLLRVLKVNQSIYEPSISDKILAICVMLALMYLGKKLHQAWPGQISVREHDGSVVGLKPRILDGVVATVASLSRKTQLCEYVPRPRQEEELGFGSILGDTKAWHVWVARILQLRSRHWHIDELGDWYAEKLVYITRYGPNNTPIGVLCSPQLPDRNQIKDTIEFVRCENKNVSKLLIVVDDSFVVPGIDGEYDIDVELYCKSYLLDQLVDFASYRDDIRYRYEDAEISEGYSFCIPDVYVPSSAYSCINGDEKNIPDVEEFLVSWSNERSLRHMAVLGEYGQGKSVLSLRLTYRLLFEERNFKRIPILIPLGGRSPRTQDKLRILADWAVPYDINPKALLALHEAGRLILIFDGFDEMDLVGDLKFRRDHFRKIWSFALDQQSKLLITGRPNFFLDQQEREVDLNIRPASIDIPSTQAIYLKTFDITRIKKALRSFAESVRVDIIRLLELPIIADSFRDLVSRPSTLFLAANIWEEIRAERQEQVCSANVIARFIRHSYERQQQKKLKPFLTAVEREFFIVGIAFFMYQQNGSTNKIARDTLRSAIIKLIEYFPDALEDYTLMGEDTYTPLKTRLQDKEMLIETIFLDVRSCGILVAVLSEFDVFSFAHKSFFELIIAQNIIYSSTNISTRRNKILHMNVRCASAPEVNEIFFVLVGKRAGVSSTVETRRFAAEILYNELGIEKNTTAYEIHKKLRKAKIKISYLRLAAILWRGSRLRYEFIRLISDSFTAYPYVFLIAISNSPPIMLSVLAYFYEIHGCGGDEFIAYERRRLQKRKSRGHSVGN
jgi:hypothetical protein